MSLLAAVVQRTIVLTLSIFYGVWISLDLLAQTVKLGPRTMFGRKKRVKPPPCLEDPSLGTHGYAHLEDIRMHYVSNGGEDKPLMLLVHGFPEFWYSWRYQLREFKDNFRVVAVDLRGYGDSDKPSGKGNYKVPLLIKDLKQLVVALGYTDCVLVGHDWGGVLAWAFAAAYPDTVRRLIILNCPNMGVYQKYVRSSFSQFKKSWYIFLFQLPLLPELLLSVNDFDTLREMLTGIHGVKTDFTKAEDLEAYKYTFSRNGFRTPINFYRAAFSLESLANQKEIIEGGGRGITMPTLIVWGEKDTALDSRLAQLSSQVCKDRVVIKYLPEASHWVQMDRPDLVNQYVREFLAE